MDSGFSEFLQTPRGRISPYLGFIPIIKCFTNVSVVWGREGCLIGPKTCDRIYKIFGRKKWSSRGCSTADFGVKSCICVLMCVLIEFGPGMAVNFVFTK